MAQDVIIREEDCGTDRGLKVTIGEKGQDGVIRPVEFVDTTVASRVLSDEVKLNQETLAHRDDELSMSLITELIEDGVTEIKVRSVLTCESKLGTCARCYGRSMASGKLVDVCTSYSTSVESTHC